MGVKQPPLHAGVCVAETLCTWIWTELVEGYNDPKDMRERMHWYCSSTKCALEFGTKGV